LKQVNQLLFSSPSLHAHPRTHVPPNTHTPAVSQLNGVVAITDTALPVCHLPTEENYRLPRNTHGVVEPSQSPVYINHLL